MDQIASRNDFLDVLAVDQELLRQEMDYKERDLISFNSCQASDYCPFHDFTQS